MLEKDIKDKTCLLAFNQLHFPGQQALGERLALFVGELNGYAGPPAAN